MNFATRWSDQKEGNEHLTNASLKVKGCVQRFKMSSIASSRASFCAVFIRFCSKKKGGAVFELFFVDSNPYWNASGNAFNATFKIAFFVLFEWMRFALLWVNHCIITSGLALSSSSKIDFDGAGVGLYSGPDTNKESLSSDTSACARVLLSSYTF